MSPLTLTWFKTCAAAAIAFGSPGLGNAANDRTVAGDLSVGTKWVAPFDVAQIERTGSYWTLGSVANEVREFMRVLGVSGPLLVRFADDPLHQPSGKLTSQVGFAIGEDEPVEVPLVRRRRPGEWVAFAVIEGRLPNPRRDYPRIRAWAKAHGRTPAGPITEVYHLLPRDAVTPSSRVEVQVVLDALGQATNVIGDADDPWSADASREESQPAEFIDPARVPEPTTSIADALGNEDFDAVAKRILPALGTLTPSQRQWLRQFALRVEAAARGMRNLYPQAAGRFVALSDALANRHRELCEGTWQSTVLANAGTVDPSWEGAATEGRKLMQGIDHLLGRIAYRAVEPDQAWFELSDLLERVNDLILQKRNDRP